MAKNIYTSYDFNGNKVQGVADGTLATDAANKGQLDAGVAEAKAYTDSKIEGLGEYVGQLDPSLGLPTSGSGVDGTIDKGDWWYINTNGNLLGIAVHKGDRLQASVSSPDTSDNTSSNMDWFVLHTFHEADLRFPINNLTLTADTPINVNHGLGYRFVHVTLVDTAGNRIDADVNYVDENNLTITSNTTIVASGVVTI